MLNKIHNWLIELVVGKKCVVMNAHIKGALYVKPNQKALVLKNHFSGLRTDEEVKQVEALQNQFHHFHQQQCKQSNHLQHSC